MLLAARSVLIAVTPADASAIATYLPVDDPSVTGIRSRRMVICGLTVPIQRHLWILVAHEQSGVSCR